MSSQNYIYGFHAIESMLNVRPELIIEVFALKGREDARAENVLRILKEMGVVVHIVGKNEIENRVGDASHQGIIARCKSLSLFEEKHLPFLLENAAKPLILILDSIQDPHNLGACLRSANAFGVDIVIAPKDKSVGITPAVRKVASGAAEITPFIQVSNLARTMRWLQEQGVWIVGTDGEADLNLHQVDMQGPIAIVMGSEGEGMRTLTRKHCDYLAKIPMSGAVESLNVSVAAGICLYEVLRQRP